MYSALPPYISRRLDSIKQCQSCRRIHNILFPPPICFALLVPWSFFVLDDRVGNLKNSCDPYNLTVKRDRSHCCNRSPLVALTQCTSRCLLKSINQAVISSTLSTFAVGLWKLQLKQTKRQLHRQPRPLIFCSAHVSITKKAFLPCWFRSESLCAVHRVQSCKGKGSPP